MRRVYVVKNKLGLSVSEVETGAPLEECYVSAADVRCWVEEIARLRKRIHEEADSLGRRIFLGSGGDEETYPLP